jgi:putative transposase
MNPAKCHELNYIHFKIAAQKVFTCTEAARCQPEEGSLVYPELPPTYQAVLQR